LEMDLNIVSFPRLPQASVGESGNPEMRERLTSIYSSG
jgi:hypothetical protein